MPALGHRWPARPTKHKDNSELPHQTLEQTGMDGDGTTQKHSYLNLDRFVAAVRIGLVRAVANVDQVDGSNRRIKGGAEIGNYQRRDHHFA